MENIAIFGGTFNPFHIGHIEILSELNSLEYIDKIIVMPSKIPPHKEVDFLASEKHRLNMCKIASKMFNKALVSDIELLRKGKSYTVDTISDLRLIYPNANFFFTLGGDMLYFFDTWKNYKEIIKNVSIICFNRAGLNLNEVLSSAQKLKSQGAKVIVLEKNITEVSSTFLRENIDNNDTLKKYIPCEILEYITENSVYGE